MPDSAIKTLETRSYTNYLSRLQAAKRMARRGRSLNVSLVSLTIAAIIASVGLLVSPEMYGEGGAALLVAVSVLTLAFSLVIPSLNYSGRAVKMTENYRQFQRLSVRAEALRSQDRTPSTEELDRLIELHQQLLDQSENHTTGDYRRTEPGGEWLRFRALEVFANAMIYSTLLVPFALLAPFAIWVIDGF